MQIPPLARGQRCPHCIDAFKPPTNMRHTRTFKDGRSLKTPIHHFASGNGGNKIYIVPDYQMVLAITSSAYGRGYGQRRSEQSSCEPWGLC